MTELGQTLEMVQRLIHQPRTKERMMDAMGVSERTLKRRIAEARHLGVELTARQIEVNERGKLTGPYYWEVTNAPEIQAQLNRWLALERARTLTPETGYES